MPRSLDMGQCNDAYGAVQVALTVANASVESRPNPPPFVTLNVFELLQDRYGLKLTGNDALVDLRLVRAP